MIETRQEITLRVLELARDAFRVTRREPRGGKLLSEHEGRACACAVGAMHLAFAINRETPAKAFTRLTGASVGQTSQFQLGFDAAFKPIAYYAGYCGSQPTWWQVGYAVGLNVRPRLAARQEHQ